jgi:hypothetical protein
VKRRTVRDPAIGQANGQVPVDILLRPVPNGNTHYFDRFSLAHVVTGAVAELAAVPAWIAIGASVGFEMVENDFKKWTKDVFPEDVPDAWQNSVGDILSFALGYYGARAIKTDGRGRMILVGLAAASGALWVSELLKHQRNGGTT